MNDPIHRRPVPFCPKIPERDASRAKSAAAFSFAAHEIGDSECAASANVVVGAKVRAADESIFRNPQASDREESEFRGNAMPRGAPKLHSNETFTFLYTPRLVIYG